MEMRILTICMVLAAGRALSQAAPDAIPPDYAKNFSIALSSLHASLREPASLSLAQVQVMKKTGSICFIYRARNGFGGMNLSYFAYLQPRGEILTTEDAAFREDWMHYCGQKQRVDITGAAQRALTTLK